MAQLDLTSTSDRQLSNWIEGLFGNLPLLGSRCGALRVDCACSCALPQAARPVGNPLVLVRQLSLIDAQGLYPSLDAPFDRLGITRELEDVELRILSDCQRLRPDTSYSSGPAAVDALHQGCCDTFVGGRLNRDVEKECGRRGLTYLGLRGLDSGFVIDDVPQQGVVFGFMPSNSPTRYFLRHDARLLRSPTGIQLHVSVLLGADAGTAPPRVRLACR